MDRALAWSVTNKKQIAWGAGLVAVVALGTTFYFWQKEQTIVNAAKALSALEAQTAFGAPRAQSADAYLKVAADHAGTAAAPRALLQAGLVLFSQGKYAEAQAQFEKLNRDYTENPFRSQALLGVAASLDAQAKPEDAARAYKDIVDRFPNENVLSPAKFSLARIYESQGKLDQARTLYEELAGANANSSLGNEAGLKADELRQKMPAPKPSAPAVTPLLTTPQTVTPKKP